MSISKSELKKKSLKKAECQAFKARLMELRQRLRGDVHHLTEGALNKTRADAAGDLSSMPIHMAEVGTDAYEQEFSLDLVKAEEGTLELIEAALERIEIGVYGACTLCGATIKKARLNAIPFTPYCIDCAIEREQN